MTLTDTARPEGAMDRLRRRFPHILTLEFQPEGAPADQRSYREQVSGRDDLAVAAEFVRHVRNSDPSGRSANCSAPRSPRSGGARRDGALRCARTGCR